MGMSLSAFISHLKSNGAFSKSYWIGFGDAMGFNAGSINNITGFGAVELAESIIEVFNLPNGDYTIRLTTSHKADYGGWICPYISRHLLSLNPLQARCRRYSRGER